MKKIMLIIILAMEFFLYSAHLPFELRSLENDFSQTREEDLFVYSINEKGEALIDIILEGEFSLSELPQTAAGIHRYASLTTLRIPVTALKELENIRGIDYIYPSLPASPLLDISTSDQMNGEYYAGCDADYIQENLTNGEGVIVGVIDPYQINWQHEDFITDNNSRIVAIWDQQATAGTPPLLFDYGAEYNQSDLNAGAGPAINSSQHHGTQCAGIAAGDGSASGGVKAGMMPAAEIIYVRQESGSSNIIDAISYIAFKASEIDASKPVVISMSVGAMFGHPEGSDPVAQALTSFGSAGRCSAVAAGNWYNYDCFATGAAEYNAPVDDLSFTIDGSNTGGSDFVISRLYYNNGDDFSISLVSGEGTEYGPVNPGEDSIFDTESGRLYISHETTSKGNPYVELVVSDENGIITAGDEWTVILNVPAENLDDEGGHWWGWIAGAGYSAEFNNYYQGAYSLNTFACGENTVCCAAHDKSSGAIYSSCSKGAPDSMIKPELSAPTNAYTASAASSTSYLSLCCTSGATPHAAGAMGLILSRNPQLTPQQVIMRLSQQAYNDGHTGETPNLRWGYGKLNTKDAFLRYNLGDIDNNGYIDAFDCSLLLMYGAGINYFAAIDPLPWEYWRFVWADVDGNEVIEAYDASLILQYVVGIIAEFPAE